MRISSQQLFHQGLDGILTVQAKTAQLQQQIATGKRILSPADDPSAVAQVLSLDGRIAALDQYQRNANLADVRLQHQDTVLAEVGDTVQRVRELVVAGKTSSLTRADRGFIAAELSQRLEELAALANTQNGSGEYIFAGTAVGVLPFHVNPAASVTYSGDQGVRELEIGDARQIPEGFSGYQVFMAIRNGNGTFATDAAAANTGSGRILGGSVVDSTAYQAHNFRIVFTAANTYDVVDDTTATTILSGQTYSAQAGITFNGIEVTLTGAPAAGDVFTVSPAVNQSVFATFEQAIAALTRDVSGAGAEVRFQQDLDQVLGDLDQARENILEIRASVGARLNTVDSQLRVNEDLGVQLQDMRSRLQDADLVEVISRLARENNVLQAAQAAFVQMQGLSLFNYF